RISGTCSPTCAHYVPAGSPLKTSNICVCRSAGSKPATIWPYGSITRKRSRRGDPPRSCISLFSYRIRSTWMSTSTATLRLDLSARPLRLQQAGRFQSAMLDSADVDLIGTSNWWDRAQTALETGAATGTRFSEVVSATARKLQITWALSKETSAEIGRLTTELSDPAAFAEWRELCQRDAVYVTALTRIHRQARRKATR